MRHEIAAAAHSLGMVAAARVQAMRTRAALQGREFRPPTGYLRPRKNCGRRGARDVDGAVVLRGINPGMWMGRRSASRSRADRPAIAAISRPARRSRSNGVRPDGTAGFV
jgi:hypothetical protein